MQREASDHPARLSMHHIDVFIARAISCHLECRDGVAEMALELRLRGEGKPANGGMQAVGSDHEIEPAFARVLQADPDAIRLLLERDDLLVEHGFAEASGLLEQQPRKIASPQRHEAPAGQFVEDPGAKAREAPPGIVHDPQFPRVIADPVHLLEQAHALGDIVSEPPDVKHVAATAQGRRPLDQGRLESSLPQPEGERRSGYPGTGDQDSLHGSRSSRA